MIERTQIDELNAALHKPALLPDDTGYDTAREIWNARIDRHPALIVQAQAATDVISAVTFARNHDLELAVRGGGHNVAGKAATEGGLLLSLAGMRSVQVDSQKRIARVEGGATIGDFDCATQAHDLATPGGVVSTTGVAGLTLGGGFGWLARKHGLAADNLVSVDLVTADGRLVRASEDENPDLFWAVRGGGGNFGVAVAFEFRLHPLGPEVLFGPTLYELDDAPAVLRHWREWCRTAPREVCVWADLLTAPPLPFLPPERHGTKVLSLLQCYAGDPKDGEAALSPLRQFGQPIGDAVGPMPYCAAQTILDETYAFGARNHWTSTNFPDLPDTAIEAAVLLAERMPTPQSDILFCQLGGAIDDTEADATAYPHRGTGFVITPGARWMDTAEDKICLDWIEACRRSLGGGSAYVNFIAENQGREHDAYGANYTRLAAVKARWDPQNLFRLNQNVKPGK